ncbi:acyl-CoA N-acyltransferase [Tothia fuscella]|uniref:Acyl-CoA N-acyltransferase n=1 Tax=Tothia fuscella TaxID=1048955 RepID=A0A9P4TZ46_9PEZI|nr:acyl-CoA N-acyltransferase [Tothia fuscella]
MDSSFHSERLIYRAPTETQEDKTFFHTLRNSRSCLENSTRRLTKPLSQKDSDDHLTALRNDMLLGVFICIPIDTKRGISSPIGYIALTSPPHCTHHRNASISIQIIEEEQGKGYGSEAIKWSLEWAFQTAGLHRISIGCISFNDGARRLYERLGFVVEGRSREAVFARGGWHDLIDMGMLEGEWRVPTTAKNKKAPHHADDEISIKKVTAEGCATSTLTY